jgi:hypothetical protein
MKILAGQQFCLTLFEPLGAGQRLAFGAMPIAARVISIPFMPALVAPFEVAAESSRATGFEGTQHTLLRGGQRGSVRAAKLLAMGAHDVTDFQSRSHEENQRGLGGGRSGGTAEEIQRTGRRRDRAGRHAQIAGRGRKAAVTQQNLNGPQISTALQQVGGESVAPIPMSE